MFSLSNPRYFYPGRGWVATVPTFYAMYEVGLKIHAKNNTQVKERLGVRFRLYNPDGIQIAEKDSPGYDLNPGGSRDFSTAGEDPYVGGWVEGWDVASIPGGVRYGTYRIKAILMKASGPWVASWEGPIATITSEPVPSMYTCPYCNLALDTQAELDQHIQAVHVGVTICPICGASFGTAGELAAHIATAHPSVPLDEEEEEEEEEDWKRWLPIIIAVGIAAIIISGRR